MTNELLTVQEVAKELRCHDTTIRRWIVNGTLDAIVLPRSKERPRYRIKRETLSEITGAK